MRRLLIGDENISDADAEQGHIRDTGLLTGQAHFHRHCLRQHRIHAVRSDTACGGGGMFLTQQASKWKQDSTDRERGETLGPSGTFPDTARTQEREKEKECRDSPELQYDADWHREHRLAVRFPQTTHPTLLFSFASGPYSNGPTGSRTETL